MPYAWKDADRIGDKIVDLLREELKTPGFNPLEMFAGQMLAMMQMLKTAPRDKMPPSLILVQAAIDTCLRDLVNWRPITSH
jgi:hypothetical protein